jgi:hypothetical protein
MLKHKVALLAIMKKNKLIAADMLQIIIFILPAGIFFFLKKVFY